MKKNEENKSSVINNKNAKGIPIKKPLINFSNFNNVNVKPNIKKFNAETPNKNKDLIDLDKFANNKSQNFNDTKEAEKKSKSSEKNNSNANEIPSNSY